MTELFRSVFDLPSDPAQEAIARRAINRTQFPWEWLLPGMAKRGIAAIKVRFRVPNLGSRFWGQFTGSTGVCLINPKLSPYNAVRTIIHEVAGHGIDAYWMTNARRDQAHPLFHAGPFEPWFGTGPGAGAGTTEPSYLKQADEGFANAMGLAFADMDVSAAPFTHVLRRKDVDAFRAIVLRPKPIPEPPEPPIPDPPPLVPVPVDPMDAVREHLETAIGELEAALAAIPQEETP